MSDLGRDTGGMPDEDRLPWLEPVEDQTAEEGVSVGRLIAGLIVAIVALGLVVGGVFWLKQRAGGPGTTPNDPTLIAAQQGPYKTKPDEPGGMNVKGQGDSSYAASEGADPNAKIDLAATPEAPIAKGQPAPPPAPAPTATAKAEPAKVPAHAPAAKPPVETAKVEKAQASTKTETASAAPVSGGGTIQLGALDSEAKANSAWKSLSGRFSYLGSLNHSVVKAEVNGKTYYRLRAAAGGQASSICGKLKVAGEACTVVG